jgi:signal transduction histidine kinase
MLSGFLAVILLFSAYVYFSVSEHTSSDFDKLLDIRLVTVAKAELEPLAGAESRELRTEFFDKLPFEQDFIFPLSDSTLFSDDAALLGIPESFFQRINEEGSAEFRKGDVNFRGIKYDTPDGSYAVVATATNFFRADLTGFLRKTLILAVLAALALSIILSYYYSKSVFKPLKRITDRVKQISSESLHLRLEVDTKNEELMELTDTFNYMLDRIETSFETQNNFISNASHELRTPLTAIIGEADVALSMKRDSLEYEESLRVILEEAEQLDRKTRALLFLAQTGFRGKTPEFTKVRMDQLVLDVKETALRLNPKNDIHLDMSLLPENPLKLKILGNEQLLHLAFSNIVTNACKYSDYRKVTVSLGATNDRVYVVVRDSGIGIPAEELKYIYDPFFRASNTKSYEGYGIGLPLARNIIRMHNGKLDVTSIAGEGTTVQISLPIGKFEL